MSIPPPLPLSTSPQGPAPVEDPVEHHRLGKWLSPVGFPNKSPFSLKDPRAGGRRGERAGSGKALSAEPKCTEVSKFLPPSPLQGSLRRGPRARNEAVHKNTAHLGGRGGIEPLTAAPSETEMCSAPIWCGKGSLPP